MDAAAHDAVAMRQALLVARRGEGCVEPNPMVGAVVADAEGRLVAEGWHERFGGPHAEVVAIERAGVAARGGTLYVTLEPCCHHGKTPPCTEAIRSAGISRVVVAAGDPFPAVNGGGISALRAGGIDVETGLLETEALRLTAPFRRIIGTGRPWVTAKWAMSLDGRIATATGESQWISGPKSRALVHRLRGRVDAIAVGIGTRWPIIRSSRPVPQAPALPCGLFLIPMPGCRQQGSWPLQPGRRPCWWSWGRMPRPPDSGFWKNSDVKSGPTTLLSGAKACRACWPNWGGGV